ncbi:PAS domain S-box-containing protein [Humidesulfovibrio mexicanus]|uniref:histidine kinase n=1 Tax=Humidesulfovibrio mexicanus TaxID=147047 RepID=A0A239BH06_9BACT|nr:PAS domain-containing protein [Humidesulfovibrio mexicanus]SNS06658.1 PAS domain S-box-containing protein [Humidesulfovibrio mexicanus]
MSTTPQETLAACGGRRRPRGCAARPEHAACGEACPDLSTCLRKLIPGWACALIRFTLDSGGRACLPFASGSFESVHSMSLEAVHRDTTPLFHMVHPEDFDRVLVSMMHSARTLSPWQQEYRILPQEGGQRWLRSCLLPHPDGRGNVVGYGLIADVTEERRARDELLELCGLGQVGVFRADCSGRYLEVNRQYAELCGFQSPELLLQRFSSFREQCLEGAEEHGAMLRVLDRVEAIQLYALALRTADGGVAWISLNLRAQRDGQGRMTAWEGFCADITEQMQRQVLAGRCDAFSRASFGDDPALPARRKKEPAEAGSQGLCQVLAHVRADILWRLRLPRLS